ncbi:gamma-secretase subunit pen-2-like [Paramacrobiotus metropolitanus]|uniref:gamma-secretase subunit pen-2-like n=1 Tax=Paramacrobiotus metropolitanus TaxID=2943436 RepID=UPI0024459C53|nr:gamma-secretase subunit pen-2-like [Paramacrobiotus metropolitanus]
MDLSRKTDAFKVDLCRKYFLAGFALLPFLWLINVIWFFKDAFLRDLSVNDDRRRIRRYVIQSFIGCVIFTAGLLAWIVIFQTKRIEWGATADYISFIVPIGSP